MRKMWGDEDGGSVIRGLGVSRKHGSPEERFWRHVNKGGPVPKGRPELGPCWLWTGALRSGKYGHFGVNGKSVCAYRFSYELKHGPIPRGHQMDHLCVNPPCVNPDHVEPVTQRTNLLRSRGFVAQKAKQTHCRRGHEYNEANTHRRANGTRQCRACWNARRLESKA